MTIGQFRPITTHPKVPWQQHSRKSMRPRCIPVEKSLRCCGDHDHLGRHRAGLIMHEPKPTHSSPPHPAAHIACMETQDGHVSLVAANTECQVNKKALGDYIFIKIFIKLRKPRRAEPTPLHGLHAHTAANEALSSDPARHDQCPELRLGGGRLRD